MNYAMPPGYANPAQIDALNTQRQDLQGQMARARGVMAPFEGQQPSTWGGAVTGGLGDVFSNIKEAQLANAIAENMKQRRGGGP